MADWRKCARLFLLLLTLALGLAYPLLIHLSLIRFSVLQTALFVLGLVIMRLILIGKQCAGSASAFTPLLTITALSALLALFLDNALTLKLTPAFVNLALLFYFAFTFFTPRTFVERVAIKQRGEPFPEQAVVYCKKVNFLWCLFFLCSSIVLALSAIYLPQDMWVWISGLGYWVALVTFFVVEWLFRTIFKEPAFSAEQLQIRSTDGSQNKNFSIGKDGGHYVA